MCLYLMLWVVAMAPQSGDYDVFYKFWYLKSYHTDTTGKIWGILLDTKFHCP